MPQKIWTPHDWESWQKRYSLWRLETAAAIGLLMLDSYHFQYGTVRFKGRAGEE